jgi:hypothetical protein
MNAINAFPPPAMVQRVSFAKSASNAVSKKKGGKAAKGKPPKAPGAAADGDAAAKAKQPGDTAAAAAGGKRQAAAVDVGQPNPRLFVEDLPSATTAAMLEMLFQQFPGGCWRGLGDALRRKFRTLLEGMFVCSASPLVLRLL